ncbi:hypothetical protein [Nonomuraea sp. B5E05]|uniref:hypothetical protein n=1 Tax=Nonomuraea sp. B5E05 TaxID=3153569 RepID=UPI0032614034
MSWTPALSGGAAARTVACGWRRATSSSMPGSGSTAVTSMPSASAATVTTPVPQPTSSSRGALASRA